MTKIKYKITFWSDWHCGAGLSAGADADMLVVKDRQGLPYVPGRTIKGLLRDAVNNIYGSDFSQTLFGQSSDVENGSAAPSEMFFSNAELPLIEQTSIVEAGAQEYLFRRQSFTRIDEYGQAAEHSLRRIETTIPCVLYGGIDHVPADNVEMIGKSMGLIKRMGMHRSRGLGRCTMEVINEEQ